MTIPGIARKRYVAPPKAYDPSENPVREDPIPKKRKKEYCPLSYHAYDDLYGNELAAVKKDSRSLEISSDNLLNLIILLHRRQQHNDLFSLLTFLEQR